MAISEEARHELFLGMEQAIGRERATTLMELLPPVGWANVATKRDLDGLETRLRAELRAEAASLEAKIQAAVVEMQKSVIDIHGSVAGVHESMGRLEGSVGDKFAGVHESMAGVHARITTLTVGFFTLQLVTLGSVIANLF